jgi:hypothetical protein
MAATPLAHSGQYRLDHCDGPEDVGGELALEIVHGGLLQHALMAITRIIDQHVDRAALPLGFDDGSWDSFEIGHVQHDRMGATGRERREGLGVSLPPHGADHMMSRLEHA